MNLTIVLGTGRKGRFSEYVATYLNNYIIKKDDIDVTYVDVADFDTKVTIPSWEEGSVVSEKWKEIVIKTDVFLMVLPEYNHSFPGEFKVLIDMAFKEYVGKKVVTVGVSVGGFGGTRMIESILPVYLELGLQPLLPSLNISNVQAFFGDNGTGEKSFGETYDEKIDKMLENLK